jgi:hypothetical protein
MVAQSVQCRQRNLGGTAETTDLWPIAKHLVNSTLRMETWISRYMRLLTWIPSRAQRWLHCPVRLRRKRMRQYAAPTRHTKVFIYYDTLTWSAFPCQPKCYYLALSRPPPSNMGSQQGAAPPVTSLILGTCSRWPYQCCQHKYLHNNTSLSMFQMEIYGEKIPVFCSVTLCSLVEIISASE